MQSVPLVLDGLLEADGHLLQQSLTLFGCHAPPLFGCHACLLIHVADSGCKWQAFVIIARSKTSMLLSTSAKNYYTFTRFAFWGNREFSVQNENRLAESRIWRARKAWLRKRDPHHTSLWNRCTQKTQNTETIRLIKAVS